MKKKALTALLAFCMAFAAAPMDAAAGELAAEETAAGEETVVEEEDVVGETAAEEEAKAEEETKAEEEAPRLVDAAEEAGAELATEQAEAADSEESTELTPEARRTASVPGTTFADAIQVECNSPYTTTIEEKRVPNLFPGIFGSEDVGIESDHWYCFTLQKSGIVSLSLSHETYSQPYFLYDIYLDAQEDKSALVTAESRADNAMTTTGVLALPAGTYYCLVSADPNYVKAGDSYQITVNCQYVEGECEKESNKTLQTATEMPFETLMNGNIYNSIQDQVDYYALNATEDGVLQVEISHDVVVGKEQNEVFAVSVLDKDGNKFFETTSQGGDKKTQTLHLGLPAGTYYLCISSTFYYTNTPYQIMAHYSASTDWEKERNDSFEMANIVAAGKTYQGSFLQSSDLDYYRVDIADAGYLQLVTTHEEVASAYGIYSIKLYGSDFAPIGSLDCKGAETKASTAKIGVAPGTYYVEADTGSFEGEYTIEVQATKAKGWETEPNENALSASVLGKDGSMQGSSMSTFDSDWFKYVQEKESYVAFGLSHDGMATNDHAWSVCLMDENGNRVAYDKTGIVDIYGKTKSAVSEPCKLSAGTYYLRVNPQSAAGVGRDYTVFLDKIKNGKPKLQGVSSVEYNKLKVTWKRVPGASEFQIFRSEQKNGTYKKVKVLKDGSATSWTDKSVTMGKIYYYKIKALVQQKWSGFSNMSSGKAIPAKSKLVAKAANGAVKLTWKKVARASGYEIWRARKGGSFQKILTLQSGNAKSASDDKAKRGEAYRYKIRAYCKVGGQKVYGEYSDAVSVAAGG